MYRHDQLSGSPAFFHTGLLGLMLPHSSLEHWLSYAASCASLPLLDPGDLPAGIHMQSHISCHPPGQGEQLGFNLCRMRFP